MKLTQQIILVFTAALGLALPGQAAVLLDDTWADGTRTEQKLPAKSAWYASKGSFLTATANSMTLKISTSSVMAVTYFTTNDVSPVQLKVGDTLTARIALTLGKVAAVNKSLGLRLGLVDFAGASYTPKRLSTDKFSTSMMGAGVAGYALFQNMGATFNKSTPMDIRKRSTLDDALLSSSDGWTSLGTGPGNTDGFPGFAAETPYVLQFALQRTGTNSMVISTTWSNTVSGATLVTSATDSVATNFNFDAIALRSSGEATTTSKITFNEVKIEWTQASPPPPSSKHP